MTLSILQGTQVPLHLQDFGVVCYCPHKHIGLKKDLQTLHWSKHSPATNEGIIQHMTYDKRHATKRLLVGTLYVAQIKPTLFQGHFSSFQCIYIITTKRAPIYIKDSQLSKQKCNKTEIVQYVPDGKTNIQKNK